MNKDELAEIEKRLWAAAISGEVGSLAARAGRDGLGLIAELQLLESQFDECRTEARSAEALADLLSGELGDVRAKLAACEGRVVSPVVWARQIGASDAKPGLFRLGVRVYDERLTDWNVWLGKELLASGRADNQADGEAKCEGAYLRIIGVAS